jgi:hypothetical protein
VGNENEKELVEFVFVALVVAVSLWTAGNDNDDVMLVLFVTVVGTFVCFVVLFVFFVLTFSDKIAWTSASAFCWSANIDFDETGLNGAEDNKIENED